MTTTSPVTTPRYYEALCMRSGCRKDGRPQKHQIVNPVIVTDERNRSSAVGDCPRCHNKIRVFVRNPNAAAAAVTRSVKKPTKRLAAPRRRNPPPPAAEGRTER